MTATAPQPAHSRRAPDGEDVARVVRASWAATRIRLDREQRAADPLARILDRLDALERRCEALEAANASLAGLLDDVDDMARAAMERAEAAA